MHLAWNKPSNTRRPNTKISFLSIYFKTQKPKTNQTKKYTSHHTKNSSFQTQTKSYHCWQILPLTDTEKIKAQFAIPHVKKQPTKQTKKTPHAKKDLESYLTSFQLQPSELHITAHTKGESFWHNSVIYSHTGLKSSCLLHSSSLLLKEILFSCTIRKLLKTCRIKARMWLVSSLTEQLQINS